MNSLPKNLKDMYEYAVKECPDLDEISHPKINISDILRAHFILADYFTDESSGVEAEKMLVGVRSFDLLGSAVGRQVVEFGGKQKYSEPLDICATLFYGLVKNHGFHDGNKRTALLVLLYQMYLYGFYPKIMLKEYERLVLYVADNSLSSNYRNIYKKFKKDDDAEIKTISYLLRRMSARKNTSIHDNVTMKELITALKNAGLEVERVGTTVKIKRKTKFMRSYQYAINYYGETRQVGVRALGDVFSKLHLSEIYPSVHDLIQGSQPMYVLVNEFENPLRRLKDE